MESIINHCSQFIVKPIGPIYACIKDRNIKDRLPSHIPNSYIVDFISDCELFKKLCQQHNQTVPDHIVYSFSEKSYDDLDKHPKADLGIIVTLNEEDPTIANVLCDHLNNIYIMGVDLGIFWLKVYYSYVLYAIFDRSW